jgi:hypothetical protein
MEGADQITMARPANIRKCYELCRSVLRNASYYRGGAAGAARPKSQFAIAASNNFLDFVYLDWCKLFWEKSGKHHFKRILPDPAGFTSDLLKALGKDGAAFDAFAKSVAHYRDKEIAHADVYETIDIPALDVIIDSTIKLYESLRAQCGEEPLPAAPYDLRATVQLEEDAARSNFMALTKVSQ